MAKEQRQKRRKFSDEYKSETGRLIKNSGKRVGQMALELDIGETALGHSNGLSTEKWQPNPSVYPIGASSLLPHFCAGRA